MRRQLLYPILSLAELFIAFPLMVFAHSEDVLYFFWIIYIVPLVIFIVFWRKIFEKVGEAGRKILIPIYNVYIVFKIIGMKNWFWYTILVFILSVLWLIALLSWNLSKDVWIVLVCVWLIFFLIVSIVAIFKFLRKMG